MYKDLKILLLAASDAYDEGSISREQYSRLLDDLEKDILILDRELIKKDVKTYILQFYGI